MEAMVKQECLVKKYLKYILCLVTLSMLFSCNNGGSSAGNNSKNQINSNVKIKLDNFLTPVKNGASLLKSSSTTAPQYYINFTAAAPVASIQLAFYRDSACTNQYGIYTAGYNYTYPAGTYRTSDQSSYDACNTAAAGLSCSQEFNNVQSFKYVYNFLNGTTVNGQCVSQKIQSSLGSACASSGNCGIQQKVTDTITPPGSGSSSYAYILNNGNSTYTICNESPADGSLNSCSNYRPPVSSGNGSINGIEKIALYNNYAYISNGDGSITYCSIDSSGNIGASNTNTALTGSCKNSGSLNAGLTHAMTVSFYKASSGASYAFIANLFGGGIFECLVSASDGSLSGCINAYNAGSSMNIHSAIVNNGYLYIAKYPNSSTTGYIDKCPINSDGTLNTTCSQFTDPNPATSALYFYVNNSIQPSATYLYITHWGSASIITRCVVDSSGNIGSCIPAIIGNNPMNTPSSLIISGNYAYFSNFGIPNVVRCALKADDGTLSSCNPIAVPINNSQTLGTNSTQINTYSNQVYIVDHGNNRITTCYLNTANGSFSSCQNLTSPIGGPSIFYPERIKIINNYAYLTSKNGVTYCGISTADGTLINCSTVSPTTLGLVSASAGTAFPIGISGTGSYLYIANYILNTNTVTQCSISQANPAPTNCSNFNLSTNTNATKQLYDINIINQYAYFTDQYNLISKCTISTATNAIDFSTCVAESAASSSYNASTVNILNGYAYIPVFDNAYTSTGGTLCSINSTGNFTSCSTNSTLLKISALSFSNGFAYLTSFHNSNSINICNTSKTSSNLICNAASPSGAILSRPVAFFILSNMLTNN